MDFLTKNAQQALTYLIQTTTQDVRFCLICNYISKIDSTLLCEFVKVRFNELPKYDIIKLLKNIVEKENIQLNDKYLESIQHLFKSDVRSMINYIQNNHNNCLIKTKTNDSNEPFMIINDEHCINVLNELKLIKMSNIDLYIHNITKKFNINKIDFLIHIMNHILKYHISKVSLKTIGLFENVVDSTDTDLNDHYLYSLIQQISHVIE